MKLVMGLVVVLLAHLRADASAGGTASLPAAALAQYRQAEQLLAHGDPQGAAAALEPVLPAYPASVELRVLHCQIELAQHGAHDATAGAACDQAAAMATDVEPAITIAAARHAAGDATGARTTLVAIESRIASAPPNKAAAAWLLIAGQYRKMDAVTWAEDAIAKAGADRGIAAWAATARARYGIPRDGARWKLTPDDDAAALTTVRDAISLVNASEFDTAAKAISAGEHRWPALPGLLTARCALELRRGALAAARQQCDRAIAQGGSSWALYLRGVLEQGTGRPAAAAIARFRAAIERDPDLAQAWRDLGRALERTKATSALDQLRREYEARFGTRLPS
jgi:tetratricopeptide (TPR) repeat protein